MMDDFALKLKLNENCPSFLLGFELMFTFEWPYYLHILGDF